MKGRPCGSTDFLFLFWVEPDHSARVWKSSQLAAAIKHEGDDGKGDDVAAYNEEELRMLSEAVPDGISGKGLQDESNDACGYDEPAIMREKEEGQSQYINESREQEPGQKFV